MKEIRSSDRLTENITLRTLPGKKLPFNQNKEQRKKAFCSRKQVLHAKNIESFN